MQDRAAVRVPVLGGEGGAVPSVPSELVLTLQHGLVQALDGHGRHLRPPVAQLLLLPAQPRERAAHVRHSRPSAPATPAQRHGGTVTNRATHGGTGQNAERGGDRSRRKDRQRGRTEKETNIETYE